MKHISIILCIAAILMAAGILLGASVLQVPSGTWLAAGTMNSARSGASSVLLPDGRILITGGDDASGPINSSEFFSASGSFSLAAPMNVPRSGQVAVVLQDGRVLVAGGTSSGGTATNTAEIYDPAGNTWTNVTGGMIEARTGQTGALLHDGRVVIAGGQNGSRISSTIEVFDPSVGRFAAVGMMSSPRTQHAMTVLADGRVLIVGGNNGTGPVGSTDIFDPIAGAVSVGPKLSVARYGQTATTLLNGEVVVIGGNNGNANVSQMDVTPAELLDPTAATPAFVTLGSNLAQPREGHLAFLLPNNNSVLIVGGTSGGTTVASAELFTPKESSQGVWTYAFGPTGSMGTARSSATGAPNQVSSPSSVAQRNGVLLVTGGTGVNGKELNSSEAYGFATVQTDQGDYPPGTQVTITGSGWQPGETVKLQLVESPLIDTHGPYTVTADGNGNITDRSFATDAHDLDVKFTLTAVGSASRAQMTFTDAGTSNVTLNNKNTPIATFGKSSLSTPMSVTAGGSNTVAFATVWVDEGSGASGTTFNVTATYGGQAMTSAGPTSYDYNYAPISSQVFYLVNPPTGTNTLVVNATASSGTIQEVVANLISYNGVNQATPVRPGTYQALHSAAGVTVANVTATISSNTSDLTLGAIEQTFHFAATPTNQTSDGVNGADYAVGSDHATTAASSISDTWSFSNTYAFYAYVGFSIQAASSGSGGGTPTLTYTANPVSRSYGTANPAFTGTVTGFMGSDTQANSTTGTLTFTSPATSASGVGGYAINGSGLTANNGKYTFVQAASNATALTITPATPIVTVTGGTFTYDGNPHGATAAAVGVDGHTAVSGSFNFTYTPPGNSTVPVSVGTYSVTANFTSSDPNYSSASGLGSIAITSTTSSPVTLNNKNALVAAFGKSSLSAAMSVTAGGSNTVAFATVWVDEGSGASGTTFNVTATYGGQAMTSAGPTSYDYNYAPISSQVFYLVNPPTGTNTLVVNATASSGTIQEVVANLISYNGVNQTTPVRPGTYQALHSTPGVTVGSFTATISSNASDLTVGSTEATYTFASPASNQTVDGTGAMYFKIGSDHAATGAGAIADTWSFTNPWAYYAYVGFSIQAASGGSSGGGGGGGGGSSGGCTSSGAPSYYQYQFDDTSNTASSPFPRVTQKCDLMVIYGSTQLSLASFTGAPTFSDGTVMTQCAPAACNFTTSNGSMNTRIWTGFPGGGTNPTFTSNLNVSGQTVGNFGLEIRGVTTLDQIASSQLVSDSNTTITSPSITTTHANEVLLCLATEAKPIANGAHFTGVGAPWTGIAFGSQAIAYFVEGTPGTYSCTVTRNAGIQDETIAIVSFY